VGRLTAQNHDDRFQASDGGALARDGPPSRPPERLAADANLTRSVWIQGSKRDTPDGVDQHGTAHDSIHHGDLAAAFGVGTLVGSLFLVLTLRGLPSWRGLSLVMIWALTDTAVADQAVRVLAQGRNDQNRRPTRPGETELDSATRSLPVI
jgi:hypothetical protein